MVQSIASKGARACIVRASDPRDGLRPSADASRPVASGPQLRSSACLATSELALPVCTPDHKADRVGPRLGKLTGR